MVTVKRRTKIIAGVFVTLILVGTAWAWSLWARIYHDEKDDYVRDPSIEELDNITNILIVGIDVVDREAGLADSIIVMSVNRNTDEVSLVSIPRDSRVEIPERGLDKINHSMSYGGISLLRATVEELLSIPIHHYIYTNFSGFERIVSSLGGVTLDVERAITVTDRETKQTISLSPGVQKLEGKQALAYVRFRKDGEGDFGRMRRQQQFLKAVAEQAIQTSSVFRMPQTFEQIARHVRTDMTITQFINFYNTMSSIDMEQVAAIQLKGTTPTIGGVSYVILDEVFLAETIRRYLQWEELLESEEQQINHG